MSSPIALAAAAAAAASDDIRDIRIPSEELSVWVLFGGGALLLLCSIGGIALWRRRRRRAHRPPRSFECALAELESTRALMVAARGAEFCSAASGVVRRYLEQGFSVPATPRTTEEFLRSLPHSADGQLARHGPRLEEFLHQCDMVKFAGIRVPPERLESLYQSACTFVRESAPEARDAEPAATGAQGP
jgi:hypothetical protein